MFICPSLVLQGSSAAVIRAGDRVSRQDPVTSGSVCIRPSEPDVGQAYRTNGASQYSAAATTSAATAPAPPALGRHPLSPGSQQRHGVVKRDG